MTLSTFNLDSEERPTLPPLHTLNLPSPSRPKHTLINYQNIHNLVRFFFLDLFLSLVIYQFFCFKRCSLLNVSHNQHHDRQVSTSSHTSASRTTSLSPSPSSGDADSEINNSNLQHTDTKFRLVPCPLEIADAVILLPAPDDTSHVLPNYVPRAGHGQGLLLVGPALQHIRHPQRQLAKGARIHPYRVVRGANTQKSRHSSIISITSFSQPL